MNRRISAMNKRSYFRNMHELRFLSIDRLLKIICYTLLVTVVIAFAVNVAGLFKGHINSIPVTCLTRTKTAVCCNAFNCLWKI